MDEAALNAAKAEALSGDNELEHVEEEAVEEEANEQAEEIVEKIVEKADDDEDYSDIEDLLPTDHKKRSDMGRRVSALLKKTDQMETIMARQQEMIELLAGKEQDEDYGEDAPLTKKDLAKFMNAQKVDNSKYENDFKSAFHTLSKDMDPDVKDAVGGILLKKFNTNETGNGLIDGATNFNKAYRYYEKAMERKIPLQGKKAPGVLTDQKGTKKTKTIEKLDKQSEKYLEYVTRTRGADAAEKLRKSL